MFKDEYIMLETLDKRVEIVQENMISSSTGL